MDTKLTLTVEKELIEKAKQYAKEKGRSLSDLVESYFKLITAQSNSNETEDSEISPFVKSLQGSFEAPNDFDYKKILQEELTKKHLK